MCDVQLNGRRRARRASAAVSVCEPLSLFERRRPPDSCGEGGGEGDYTVKGFVKGEDCAVIGYQKNVQLGRILPKNV